MNRYIVLFAVLLGCSDEPSATQAPTGELIGRIEIAPDVPAGGCRVLLEGTPLGARCDGAGAFDIPNVVPGRWDLRVVADESTGLPARRIAVAANPGFVTDLGAIRIAQPGAIGGRVLGASDGVVVVPAFGIVTAPNANGGYLLANVPPGIHEVVFIADGGSVSRAGVNVLPGKTTTRIDLDASQAVDTTVEILGTAVRANRGEGGHGGLTVQLIDAATGVVVLTTDTAADGSFSFSSVAGVYVLVARDGDSPITAIFPSVVPHGTLPFTLPSPLVVFPIGGDLDGDGIKDADDPDIDNDGVANEADAFPFDPAESEDADADGLGDHADLATQGVALDTQQPTPDTDGDGLLDFEDICPLDFDAAQTDSDGDGIGDACDNCVLVPNPDQVDTVGNGVGNACRACNGNEACPLGQTCQQGSCVECTASTQCNGGVCVNGGCVPCSATVACDSGLCNLPVGTCQECLVNLDCGAGAACVGGHCFGGCDLDADCGGTAFCVQHACVECRGNADCPSQQWCDAGLCQPQCSVNANCSGGRICDQDTRTCVLPCVAGCPTGQDCAPDNTCRAFCDGSFPCTGGQVCTAGLCGPACTDDPDCGPLEVCQLGECVPSGACNLDTDCSASEMCGQFGACIARPTSFDPGAGAFTCTTACDCKLGETCGGGHCVPDGVPTRFVAVGAGGNGLSITSPSGNLHTTLAGIVAGDVVAIQAGPTLVMPNAVPPDVTASNVKIQGGYVACNATRWVRDPTQPTRLHQPVANNGRLLSIGHNFAVPTSNVVIRNLILSTGTNMSGLDAQFTPNLRVEDVVLDPGLAVNTIGLDIQASSGVVIDGVTVASYDQFTFVDYIKLDTSAGAIRNVALGNVTGVLSAIGIHVLAASGPVTIDQVTQDLWSYFNETNVILVENTPLTTVTITNVQMSAASRLGSGSFGGIHAKSSADVRVADCSLDGTGFIDPNSSPGFGHFSPVWFENSAGTIDRVTIDMPQITSVRVQSPIYILGPEGGVTIRDTTVTGRGGPVTRMIAIENVVDSTTVIDGGTFSSIQTGTLQTSGLFASNSHFVLTDATFELPGTALEVYGFEVDTNSIGRIERSRFKAGGVSTVTDRSVGGRVAGDSLLELYGNWLVGGAPTKVFSAGLWLEGDFTLRAIGNTIEAGGSAGQPGASIGVRCEPDAGQGQVLFSSNIVDGGFAASHFMVHDATTSACSLPASWDHNYFAFRGAGARNASALEVADDITSGGTLNQIQDGVTCFVNNDPVTGFSITAGSGCVNAGVAGTRLDTTPIVIDLLGNPRVVGGTADIGAQERP